MANKKTTVEFNTEEYQFSHGAEPRGRGGWAFALDRVPTSDKLFWTPSMTYGEAIKFARAHYAALGEKAGVGLVVVYVQP